MTSVLLPSSQTSSSTPQDPASASATPAHPIPTPSITGAVPAQQPGRSYASAITATPSPPAPAGVSASAQNAKSVSVSPVNGATPQMAQGGPQSVNPVPNGTSNSLEHSRKTSVVISASGASGYTQNGGPVGQGTRPPINFGSINQGSPLPTASTPYSSQASAALSSGNPRVTSPLHTPSPIPPTASVSGGRLPLSGYQQTQGNGMTFGSMGGDEQVRQNSMSQAPLGPGNPMHERRTSSQSMQSDMSGMNRNFAPPNGRGRGFTPQQPYNAQQSPAPNFRQTSNPRVPSLAHQQMSQQQMGPGSPYNRGRSSPAINPAQPNMQSQHMAGSQHMQYGGYPQQMGPPQHQQQQMYGHFDPQTGYYGGYWSYGQQPPPSPRPYPSPYGTPGGQPPFYPPQMSRSASNVSERPPSAMGHPQTPLQQGAQPSQAPSNQQAQPAQSSQSQFVKPKKTTGIMIKDPVTGKAVVLPGKDDKPKATESSTAQSAAGPSQPVIVATPSAPTPPPRTPSSQHVRAESKVSTQTAEEKKTAFQEQVKRQMEEARRKAEEEEAAKAKQAATTTDAAQNAPVATPAEEAQKDIVMEASAEAEKAAAVDAGDEQGAKSAEAAVEGLDKKETKEESHEETEEERMEREIAEMEAAEREEEERERTYQEKKKKEKEANAAKEAEAAAKADEELKQQEREAEEREAQRERERETASTTGQDQDEESKAMFAALKKPAADSLATSAADSGTETPASEDADQSSPMPPPAVPGTSAPNNAASRPAASQKPKPNPLKLETVSKRVEPSEPTPGMQALRSARFLELAEELKYPDGFKSPNPALNANAARKARAYDRDFLLQFQNVFKEKPSVDWDQKIRETLGPGDEPGSARAGSNRSASSNMGGRTPSGRPGSQQLAGFGGTMGSFGSAGPPMGARTLPPNTTSEQRFAAASMGARPGMGAIPQIGARVPSQLGMGSQSVGMSRTNSLQTMAGMQNPGSPRANTRGGARGSRRGDRTMSKKEEAELASKMPLTAHIEVAPLVKSTSGWQPSSIGQPLAPQHDLSGNMAPDMVQRKVKAALNKMTPEKFDKISDGILEIAAQSKNESDGRTLRQVIQLTFEKACDEAHWAGMYARFCSKMLTSMSIEIKDETIKDKAGNPVVGGALFRKYLLNRCQEEFERGWQVNLPEVPEGGAGEAALLSEEYYVAAAAKRRGLGLIQFIGQLYKLRMLTIRIMHECVQKLLDFEGDPDEAAVENLTTLLRAVGATMEEDEQGPQLLNMYFDRIDSVLLKSNKLGSRPKFMIMDLMDLRRAGWKGKDDSKGPKTIAQIHEEAEAAAAKAEAERQRQSQRGGPGGRPPAGRGDARNFSGSAQPPVDYQKSHINMDDLRKLQNRGSAPRQMGGSFGPGGSLGPGGSMLGQRTGSRRGAGNLGAASSGHTTRTNTPPVDSKEKKEEQSSSQNAFGALASLDPSGEAPEDAAEPASSPPTAAASLSTSTSPQMAAAEKAEATTSTAET